MKIKNVVVSGEQGFLHRHQFLFKTLSSYFEHLEYIPSGEFYESKILNTLIKVFNIIIAKISLTRASRFWKNEKAFIARSKLTERKIRRLTYTPDLIFHVFSQYSPLWNKFDIPYVMYLDYTMALARKNWISWSPFSTQKEFADWEKCERKAYEKACYIFTMSNLVKSSLVQDYRINSEKITVIGSAANRQPYEGEKTFGSKIILFNGSDFERKGGNLVLAAFKQVKTAIPEARLVIVGKDLSIAEAGVDNPGRISSLSEMQNLFLKADLVVAPALCDPFPTFVIEALNYGVPCIVSASDGMPEIIDNGVNGIVIEQPTPDVLAQKIIHLLDDIPRLKSMSEKAREKVKIKLNWDSIAKNIAQVLSTV